MTRTRLALGAASVALALAACGGDDDAAPPTAVVDEPMADATEAAGAITPVEATVADPATSSVGMADDTASAATTPAGTAMVEAPVTAAATSAPAAAPTVELAAWQTMPITDVDGVTFTLAEYVGRPLLVETFATWCTKCRAQLGDTQQAAAELGDEAAVVALSVETDLSSSDVADYAADNGFDAIRFAVMSPELLAAMADAFGTTVANPPSTPKIVVTAAGQAGDLTTGPEAVDDLVATLRAATG